MACRICGVDEFSERITAREMMFGSREAFEYERCGVCGTLQIVDMPDDLERFYASEVDYSFNNFVPDPLWKNLLKSRAARTRFHSQNTKSPLSKNKPKR
ncbi:MAG: hypothetical protein KJP27_08430 [Altererythrobacter sp.]|nr:hypothetical protein [Altererythrobacter sp.]